MKNRIKTSKSWLCFRPDMEEQEPRSIDSPVYNAVKPRSTEKNCTKEIPSSPKKSSSSRRGALSEMFKVLIKSRKVQQDPYHALRSIQELRSTNNKPSKEEDVTTATSLQYSSKNKKAQHPVKKPSKEEDKRSSKIPAGRAVTTALLPTSSSPSDLATLSDCKTSYELGHKVSEDSKQSKTMKNTSLNGLVLLLISLFVLVFWGRVCAIICTSAWIYFGPSFRRKNEDEEVEIEVVAEITKKTDEVHEMGTRQYKKRVIMEGLLERTHYRI